ncbi:hypothetical protein OMAG_000337 [Candidatus Omnitrophus magneticus]|uniref:Uncharacterized protein n=1 Tax=Candidatus Omnitrophus magneticus TaxID=1609969 RepID=A0A0F0CR38_9BACT|nr:hypothetical protein OMAG_000337 [Candidatus Omnitrophus magneticus]
MNLSDIQELYFITAISNITSIMSDGIFSHNDSERVPQYALFGA